MTNMNDMLIALAKQENEIEQLERRLQALNESTTINDTIIEKTRLKKRIRQLKKEIKLVLDLGLCDGL